MTDNRILLRVMGLSYNQIQDGAYALILAQVNGPYRIPIIIGAAEAQSIAIKLEGITPPRPLTHDLFVSFAHAFGIVTKEVFIHKFEDGIFSSEITFTDNSGRTMVVDARTSDAIAIALRNRAPIFTTPEIINETGFILEDLSAPFDAEEPTQPNEPEQPNPEDMTIEELEHTLSQLINDENYETAAKIVKIIRRKRGDSTTT